MFDAYSEKLHTMINIKDAFDVKEVFCCPNLNCPARFTIRSESGTRAKHFARLPSTQHKDGCIFMNGDERYLQPNMLVKNSLEAIFENSSKPGQSAAGLPGHRRTKSERENNILYVNTPNQLLKFCIMNSIFTEYLPGKKVDDIILDSRNLIRYGRFRGIEGLRFVVGETVDWQSRDTLFANLIAFSKNDKRVTLHIAAKVGSELLEQIRKYLIATHGKYGGNQIAIWGAWKNDRQYHISCEVTDRKHVIFKF